MLAIAFGVLVGLALGLTGGGGSVFAIPLLVYGLHLAPQEAATISLAAVAIMAVSGVLSTFRESLIEFRAGLLFALSGMLGAPLGVHLGDLLPGTTILTGFALLMLAVAATMWFKTDPRPQALHNAHNRGKAHVDTAICRLNEEDKLSLSTPCGIVLSVVGFTIGVMSGLFGVGGGFIIVPALMAVTQLSLHRAVATSLFVIALIGVSGVFSALAGGRVIPLALTGYFILGGIAGTLLGRVLSKRIPVHLLQRLFAMLMIVVAGITLLGKTH